MWVPVEGAAAAPAPCARGKHAAALLGEHVYVLGGRGAGGSLPLKDVWRYSLTERRWQPLRCAGAAPPALQQHSCTPHGAALYVFGGEAAAADDTPLWRLDTQTLIWRKISAPVQSVVRRKNTTRSITSKSAASGAGAGPRGRRGHSAHALNDCLLIYGGYMDLRGSSNELWAFHYESETWTAVRTRSPGPARHRHAAAMCGARLYVHGGQCDLRDAAELWSYDTLSREWAQVRPSRAAPGARAGHVAAPAGQYLYIFGGEVDGHPTNEMWRFHFENEGWERIVQEAGWPAPRADCCALLLPAARGRPEEGERVPPPASPRPASPLPAAPRPAPPASLLREISKLSSFHLRRHNRCAYSVLGGGGDSSESLRGDDAPAPLPKSHSAYVLARRRAPEPGPREADLPPRRLAREPISVPDFADMVLPTPVLSPAEASKLVYLDSDEEEQLRGGGGAATVVRFSRAAPDTECSELSTSDYASSERVTLGFSNPHYLGGDVRALRQALTPDSGVDVGGGALELRELRPRAPPALRLLLLGGKEAPHAARLRSALSMWTYRLQ